MSKSFTTLHDGAFFENDTRREQRWEAVLAIADMADVDTIEVLTRLAFVTLAPPEGRRNEDLAKQFAAVTSRFSAGEEFDAGRQRRELQLVAAAALVEILPRDPDAGLAVALASFGGRSADLPVDLPGLAEEALAGMSGAVHARAKAGAAPARPVVDFAVDDAVFAAATPPAVKAEIERLRDAVTRAMGAHADRQNAALASMSRRIAAADEELQMLWWLTNGVSLQSGVAFSKIEGPEKALLLADELAGLTDRSPGPRSVRALLARAGVGAKRVPLSSAVNGVTGAWASEKADLKRVSPVTTPIHFAFEKRIETGADDAWQPAWSSMTGLPRDIALPASTIAMTFYRERLLLTVAN